MIPCYRCGTPIPADKGIYRNTECDNCGADLKVCLHCEFYDPASHWECRESIPERVKDKDRANFCDYFRLRRVGSSSSGANAASGPGASQAQNTDSASQLRRLFGEE